MSDDDAPPSTRRVNTDGTAEALDGPISLIDTLAPTTRLPDDSRESSPGAEARRLTKAQTKLSVEGHLARRKYAEWQQERFPSDVVSTPTQEDPGKRPGISRTPSSQRLLASRTVQPDESEATDFAAQNGSESRQQVSADRHVSKRRPKPQPSETDILYENQRGMFFFGIPLYSHSSLLNFDPAAWQTKDLKDSAVNITNAQVPDPSWEWKMKSWHVDMSYDVDEEGWQYSFSFGRKWAWHGNHPWFHSFTRRRRWLRTRVSRKGYKQGKEGTMLAAHQLAGDYFTIHPQRDRSPVTTMANGSARARDSFVSQRTSTTAEEPPEDLGSIRSLLRALRLGHIDREKIEAVKKFVETGGEELAYLREHVPEIMSFLVFQTSKRQLLGFLQESAHNAQEHRNEHEAENKPEKEAETRRIDNLLNAVRAVEAEIKALEYWSDRTDAMQTSDEGNRKSEAQGDNAYDGASTAPTENDPVSKIKSISDKAELEFDPTHSALSPVDSGQTRNDRVSLDEKGKGKAIDIEERPKDFNGVSVRDHSDRGMPAETLFVPDEKRDE